MRRVPLLVLGLAVALVGLAPPASAVLIASGDGTGNTTAPADDPGFGNVRFQEGGPTAVYLGKGWVITAHHAGVDGLRVGGVIHEAVAGSGVQLETAPGEPADLRVYRLVTDPGLPSLTITSAPPAVGDFLVLAGAGLNRGPATSWRGIDGWEYGTGSNRRWGTNVIEEVLSEPVAVGTTSTRAFTTEFTEAPQTEHEAQAIRGDSGGAAFVETGSGWELAGIPFVTATFANQPVDTALYGNLTYHVDLDYYRSQILDVVSVAACEDGSDQDGDGLVDLDDPGCEGSSDAFETDASLACDNGFDDDGDGLVDLDDPGCGWPGGSTESPACDDGIDNDGDGLVDYPEDPQCSSGADDTEANQSTGGSCGLVGLDALAVLLAASALRRAARRLRARSAP